MYSQNGEDDVILELVCSYLPTNSTFIDVGAYDGCTRSNTLALVERGWGGILVEPSPVPFQRLTELHGSNPKLTLVNAVLGPTNSWVNFWPSEDGVSTTVEAHYQKWKENGGYGDPITALQLSFSGLWMLHPVQFAYTRVLSIDTEGSSVDVLETFPFNRVTPTVVCVEYDDAKQRVLDLLKPFGYTLKTLNAENMVLAL